MFDPMQMGLMSMMAAQQPETFAQAMAAAGQSPTSLGLAQPQAGAPLGGLLGGLSSIAQNLPGAGLPAVQPPAAAAMPPGAIAPGQTASPLSALQGVKAPQAPAPIMNAGVSGSEKAPTAKAVSGMSGGSEAILRALLAGGGAGIPSLATLLSGVR